MMSKEMFVEGRTERGLGAHRYRAKAGRGGPWEAVLSPA